MPIFIELYKFIRMLLLITRKSNLTVFTDYALKVIKRLVLSACKTGLRGVGNYQGKGVMSLARGL